jgi:curved DNA-binding protein CbpA
MANFYEVLQVAQTANRSEVKKAYRKLTRTAHPDRGGSAESFRNVQEAWETLGNDKRRELYDRNLSNNPEPVYHVPSTHTPPSQPEPPRSFTYDKSAPVYTPPSSYTQPKRRTGQRFEEESKKEERARLLAEENVRQQGQEGYTGPRMKNGAIIPDWESLPHVYDKFKFSNASYTQVREWRDKDNSFLKLSAVIIISIVGFILIPLAVIAGLHSGMVSPDWIDTWIRWAGFSILYGLVPVAGLFVIVLAIMWAYRFLRYQKRSKLNFSFDYRNIDFSEIDLSRVVDLVRFISRL